MDEARLQQVLGRGYGIAASKVGGVFDVYRPSGASDPLSPGNKIGSLNASFTPHNASGFSYDRPSDHQSPLYHGLYDLRTTQVFDYLVSPTNGTFFVSSQDPVFPPLCIECQRTVSITRPKGTPALGLNGYGGNVVATEVPVMTNWPASLLEVGGKQRGASNGDLPGDVGSGSWTLYLPHVDGVVVRNSDILVDDLDRRYVLGVCELQRLGWRCKAIQMVT